MGKAAEAFKMYEEDGLRVEVIADILNSSPDSVKVMLRNERKARNFPSIRDRKPRKTPPRPKAKKPLVPYAGRHDLDPNWKTLAEVSDDLMRNLERKVRANG